ncbi:uncharacterized protein LOC143356934 [Halictus rubicundus]|uniref:uncharacterized protein LOC143356934 n=1 Tax=Halictus rubicundus TaxID=77578 RepID=UPI004036C663
MTIPLTTAKVPLTHSRFNEPATIFQFVQIGQLFKRARHMNLSRGNEVPWVLRHLQLSITGVEILLDRLGGTRVVEESHRKTPGAPKEDRTTQANDLYPVQSEACTRSDASQAGCVPFVITCVVLPVDSGQKQGGDLSNDHQHDERSFIIHRSVSWGHRARRIGGPAVNDSARGTLVLDGTQLTRCK